VRRRASGNKLRAESRTMPLPNSLPWITRPVHPRRWRAVPVGGNGQSRRRGREGKLCRWFSRPLSPPSGIAAALETCDNGQRFVCVDDEHQGIRKAAQKGARMLLYTTGNCRGLELMRSTTTSTAARNCRPRPGASFSYQSCASINSSRARGVKITGVVTGNAAQARSSKPPR